MPLRLRPGDYVDLDRRFLRVGDEEDAEQAAFLSYTWGFYSTGTEEGLCWDDLLALPRVVVLGKPGIGKSYDFKAVADRLRDKEQSVFYLELHRLVKEQITDVLDHEQKTKLASWLHDSQNAIFLLDAVDESKLQQPKDFFTALQRLSNAIAPSGIDRATIIISSRVSAWDHHADTAEVLRLFPVPRTRKTTGNTPDGANHTEGWSSYHYNL